VKRLQRPLPAALLLVLLWTAWRLAYLAHAGIPQPKIHDEFSYLLQADTFAHGRLANPPPPFGRFFESFHVLVHPSYASKYPPGQAMFLALGQVLFGHPFYGVLIGNALMLFTFCLMLFAWVPWQWAIAVAGMFGLTLWPGMYWTNSYWGGSVAASGGALVLLAVGLYLKRPTVLAGLVFGLGALFLFWTRPFEGGVFTLMVLIVFARELWQSRRAPVLFTTLSVLALGGAWTGYDDFAVTGNPLLLPYVLYQHQYEVIPVFWFLPVRAEPTDSNPRIAALEGTDAWGMSRYRGAHTGLHRLASQVYILLLTLRYDLGIALVLLLLVPVGWRDSLFRKMAIISGGFVLALGVETYDLKHYTAPVWAGLALLIAIWAKHAWNLRIGKLRVGAAPVILAFVSPLVLTGPLLPIVYPLLPREIKPFFGRPEMPPVYPDDWADRRAALIRRLSALPGPQLVFVRYPSPDWRVHEEWVYNGADINHQRVVLAHDFGQEEDEAMLHYYSDRSAWLLTFDPASGLENIEPYLRTPLQP